MAPHAHATKAAKHDPPARTVDPDVADARAQAKRVNVLLESARSQRALVSAAQQRGNPVDIREAAAVLSQTRAYFLVAAGVIAHDQPLASGDRELAEAREAATEAARQLSVELRDASTYADLLAPNPSGTLTRFSHSNVASPTPEALRQEGAQIAPLGPCDFSELQHPDSMACPFPKEQRTALREKVANEITSVAADWKDAIRASELDERFASLNSSGLHPLVGLLLDIATGFAAGRIATAASLAIEIGKGVARSDAERKGTEGQAAQLAGLAKRLGDYAIKSASNGPPHDVKGFYAMADGVANAWRRNAADEIRSLTDPALLSVARTLGSRSFDRAYFDGKIAALLTAFKNVSRLGDVDHHLSTMVLVYITSAKHPARLAVVRRRSVTAELSTMPQPNDIIERILVGSDRLDFEQWVDRSVSRFALDHTPHPPIVHDGDPRWATPPTGAWLHREEGITMFDGTTAKDSR